MGSSGSKATEVSGPKLNKDHKRDKTFRVGLSFGKGDLSMDGHFQMGYVSKTKKVYTAVQRQDTVPLLENMKTPGDDENS